MRDSDRIFPDTNEPADWAEASPDVLLPTRRERRAPVPTSDRLIAEVIGRISQRNGRLAGRTVPPVSSEQVDALCDALISSDHDAAVQLVRSAEAEGLSPDALCMDYIAAAARRMGERWVADCASFLDVTLAGGRLLSLVRDLAPAFGGAEQSPLPGHAILIATVPGETHNLGAAIAAECFRRARWDVTLLDGAGTDEITGLVGTGRFPVVGLSAGARRMVPVLAETVRAVRRINPDVVICVGGPILALEPEIVRTVGADHAAAEPTALSVMLHRQIECQALLAGSRHV